MIIKNSKNCAFEFERKFSLLKYPRKFAILNVFCKSDFFVFAG
jgi:hypothetical protein